MAHMVPIHLWDAQLLHSGHHDKIAVHNLDVVVNAGTDVWGRRKTQRALISVTVTLRQQFASASATDTVDQSTVHYGTLSKAIQARLKADSNEWRATASLSNAIMQSVREVAGPAPVFAIQTDVRYIKGSMFGEGVGHTMSAMDHENLFSNTLYLCKVRVPCLIGVNANERLRKQPVLVSVWADCVSDARVDDYAELEEMIFNIISETTYQTIESLLEYVISQLRQRFFINEEDKDVWIRLRVAKPLAVPFAEAPAVEIRRQLYTEGM